MVQLYSRSVYSLETRGKGRASSIAQHVEGDRLMFRTGPRPKQIAWVKWHVDFFQSDLWRSIEGTAIADTICTIRLQLICLAAAVNDVGRVYNRDTGLAYSNSQLARYFRRDELQFASAFRLLCEMGHLRVEEDGTIVVAHWPELYAPDANRERERLKKQKQRLRQKLLDSRNVPLSEHSNELITSKLEGNVPTLSPASPSREEEIRKYSSSSSNEDEECLQGILNLKTFHGVDTSGLLKRIHRHGEKRVRECAEAIQRSAYSGRCIKYPLRALDTALLGNWDAPAPKKASQSITASTEITSIPIIQTPRPGSNIASNIYWTGVKEKLKRSVGEDAVTRWFEPLVPILDENCLRLWCPAKFFEDWITQNYRVPLSSCTAPKIFELFI